MEREPLPVALLFDMDGTLIDSEHLWLEAETSVMTELGVVWTADDQAHCLGGPLGRVADYMAMRAGISASSAQVGERLLARVGELFRREPLMWRPGARELLSTARDAEVPCALVSATWRSVMTVALDQCASELDGWAFDVTVAGDEVRQGKPHPEPYLTAADLLGVDIAACAVLEDSPVGVASGAASGAFVVAIPHLTGVPASERTVIVPSLVGVDLDRISAWMRGRLAD